MATGIFFKIVNSCHIRWLRIYHQPCTKLQMFSVFLHTNECLRCVSQSSFDIRGGSGLGAAKGHKGASRWQSEG